MRNRLLLPLSFCTLGALSLSAQIVEQLGPVTTRSFLAQKQANNLCDTIGLPLMDDFSGVEGWPDQRRWCDSKVWVNDSYGWDVPTLGVATFDGLDENGQAYDILDNSSDSIADVLTSKFIRFGPNPSGVYLSFFYQEGGRGERPRSGDALTVDFWSPQDSAWLQVWKRSPLGFEGFRAAIIPVDSSLWLQDGYRFRFAAYGARSGSFDIWNVDYVRLEENRNAADTAITDAAFTRQHPSLLKDYWQIPWFHLQGVPDPFKDEFDLHYKKNGDSLSVSINLRGYELFYDGTKIQQKNGIPWNNFSYNKELIVPVPLDPVSLNPAPSGEFDLSVISLMTGANDGFRSNDTVKGLHRFSNYYAYDDGSAERVYGLSNVGGAVTAILFTPLKPDTLKGLYLYFGQAKVDAKLNDFQIGIWENQNGIPGNELYLSDSVYVPEYFNHDQFSAYALDSSIYVDASVFIGLKQRTVEPLNVGLDVNRPDGDTTTHIFYNDGINWYQSLFPGNLMLRPYFNYQPTDLSSSRWTAELNVHPNPADDRILIQTGADEDRTWALFDLYGRTVDMGILPKGADQLDISAWPSGLYYFRVLGSESSFSAAVKLIVH